MEILGTILFGIGVMVSLIGGIWFLIVAFRESVLWGLGCLLVPFVSLIFLCTHFQDSAKPFGVSVLGALFYIAGGALSPGLTN